MEEILAKINKLGPFELNLLSTAVFAFVILITQFFFKLFLKWSAKHGKLVMSQYAEDYLQKFLMHRAIFGSAELAEPLRLFFLVILTSIAWLALGIMFLVFFYGVKALAAKEWLIFLGHWFAFNCIFEGFRWARDCRNDKTPKIIFEAKYGKKIQDKTAAKEIKIESTQETTTSKLIK